MAVVVVAVVLVEVVDAAEVPAVGDVRLVEPEALEAGAVVLAELPCSVAAFAPPWSVGALVCGFPWVVGAEVTGCEVGATGACAFCGGALGPAFAEAAATDSIAATSTILDTRMVILRA